MRVGALPAWAAAAALSLGAITGAFPASAAKRPASQRSAKASKPSKPPKTRRQPKPARPATSAVVGISGGRDALVPFFAGLSALAAGEGALVRVLHLGDSHVAADYWTGELRRLFQAQFGDAGPGLVMPGRPWRFFRHARARSLGGEGWETEGLGRNMTDGLHGLSGVGLVPFRPEGVAAARAEFAELEVQLADRDPGGCASIAVDGVTLFAGPLGDGAAAEDDPEACSVADAEPSPDGHLRLVTVESRVPLGSEPHLVEVTSACGGSTRLLGVDLRSGRPGVLWDALGLNGAELQQLERADRSLRALLMSRVSPALIVVSYGTNEMGRSDLDLATFRESATSTLRALREDAPGAGVLVTGPIDRSGRSRRLRGLLKTTGPLVVRALREAALATGCAFWDARAAMGGNGSIERWARAGLAQRDLVHLTGPGYEKLARLLHERLLAAWHREARP